MKSLYMYIGIDLDNDCICIILYAYDIVMLAENQHDFQTHLNTLHDCNERNVVHLHLIYVPIYIATFK